MADAASLTAARKYDWPAALLVLALLVGAAGWFEVHNLDVWLHARTGQWIVEHARVPATNVLSALHHDYPSVHDKWAFQVLTHGLLDGLGPNAVIVARIAVMLLLFGTLAATARRLGAGPWASLLLLSLAVLAARGRFQFRPDLVSLLLQAAVTHLVLTARAGPRRTAALLLLQLLWVQLHGYFLLGWVTVAAAGAGHLLAGRDGRAEGLRLLRDAAGMAAICLLNPAGVDGWLHPFAILADLARHRDFYTSAIEEFRPTFAPDPHGPWDRVGFLLLGALTGALLLAEVAARRRAARLGAGNPAARLGRNLAPSLVLFLLFAAMSPSLRRNMAPCAVVAAPIAAACLGIRLGSARLLALPSVALALVLAAGELTDTISVHDGLQRRSGWGCSELSYPDTGIDFIASQLPQASVFTAFRYGSTFTGRRWPAQVASINGNTHGYPTEYLLQVMSALSGENPIAFDLLVARNGHDVALLPMASPLSARLLRASDWTLVCLGRHEAVYVRRASADPAWLLAHDLEPALMEGQPPPLPSCPPCGRILHLPKACVPTTAREAAALFLAAGYAPAAAAVARAGLLVRADDPELLAVWGLVERARGDSEEARALLRRSLDAPGYNRLGESVRRALEGSAKAGT